ncbi:MAG: hypothetical protein HC853_19410 [Anaerolineae bacterium]|nr:hypothetical protein [Anaerolineae bacterium]
MAKQLTDPLALYRKYYVDRGFERLDLFAQLARTYGITSALYPGSFVHITPSFVFPRAIYVDEDKQAQAFFQYAEVQKFVAARKIYAEEVQVEFIAADYRTPLDVPDASVDLLISQYAGFISLHCKRYLRVGGFLLTNNSHGDASMASLDADFALVAVVQMRVGKAKWVEENLAPYLTPKNEKALTRADLEKTQRGIGYVKAASDYVFKRVA